MSAEQLNVQKQEENLKNTVQDAEVKKVDTLLQEIELAQKNKTTKKEKVNNKIEPVSTEVNPVSTEVNPVSTEVNPVSTEVNPVSTEVTAKKNYTKEYKTGQEKIKEEEKLTTIEKETIKAFINNSPAVIDAIITNTKDKFFDIEIVKGETNISTLTKAKDAFKNDITYFQNKKNYTTVIGEDPNLKKTMDVIKANLVSLENRIELKNIQKTPAYADNFNKAKIETLLTLTATLKDGKEKEELKQTLTNKKTATESTETSDLSTILSKEPTLEVAKELFETNESAWNALMATGDKLQLTTETQNANFKKLMESYVKIAYKDATGITYGRLKYPITEEYYIQAQTAKGEVVNIKFGKTSDILYQAQADNNDIDRSRENYGAKPTVTLKNETNDFTNKALNTVGAAKVIHDVIDMSKAPKKIQITRKNGTTKVDCTLKEGYTDGTITTKTNTYITSDNKIVKLEEGDKIEGVATTIGEDITSLDGIGSYREFEDVIEKQTDKVTFLKRALQEGILDAINTNTHGGLDQSAKKNGYYKVIIEQIVATKDNGLISAYLGNIVVDGKINVKYLGTDNKNQLANLAILQKSGISAESENGKLLAKISAQLLKDADPKTIKEHLSSLMDAFGPMLFSVLKLLGFSKNKLIKMFGAEKVESIYKKEYGLTPNQIAAIKSISENTNFDKTSTNKSILETGGQLETEFEKKKDDYIKLIETGTTKVGETTSFNYTFLNVNTFKAGLTEFNKDKNINDVVTITTDSKTGKSSITEIKDSDTFKGAMKSILDNDATWSKIATANTSIQTDNVENKVKTGYNAQGLKVGANSEASTYKIQGQQDIARYLTAGLFSNKDLADVVTVNKLNNGTILTETKEETKEKPVETLVYKDEKNDFKDKKLTNAGAKKMIHDVIDMTKAPKKIQITRKDGTTKIDCTLQEKYTNTKDSKITTATDTYVDATGLRVSILEGDSFSILETAKTPEVADTWTKINTELTADATKTAQTTFEGDSYALDDTNVYQKQLTKLSDMFTGTDYEKLTTETSITTLSTMVTKNMSHLKNMFIYQGLKQTKDNKDAIYGTDKLVTDKSLTSQTANVLDTKNQKYTVEVKDKTITIKATKNTTESTNTAQEGTITITKDASGKLTTTRLETPVVVAKN